MSSPLTISELIQHLEYVQRTQGVEPTDLVLLLQEGQIAAIYAGSREVIRQEWIEDHKTEDGTSMTAGVFTLSE
jgi:hypothetical protein